MPRLSEAERNQAIGMLRARATPVAVGRAFGCTTAVIYRLIQRMRDTGNVRDRPRAGRPRVTTPRDDRAIRLTHLRQRFLPATVTARQYHVSGQTIRNRLRVQARPMRAYRPYTGSIIRPGHRRARLQWARRHRRWRRRNWDTVLFSDESRYNLSHADGRVRVYRRKGERFAEACVRERDRFGGGGVMVWGGIMGGRKTRLIVVRGNMNAARYINEILTPEVIPFLRRHGPGIFQQDNARPHTAIVTRNHLQANNVNVLPWPAVSPDMNPIEHVWDELGRRTRQRHAPQNVDQLANALVTEWNAIPNNVIQTYVNSMRRRINAVINARGGHNRY